MIIEQLYEDVSGSYSSSPSMLCSKTHKQKIRDHEFDWIFIILTHINALISPWCIVTKWIIIAHIIEGHCCQTKNIVITHLVAMHHWGPSWTLSDYWPYHVMPVPIPHQIAESCALPLIKHTASFTHYKSANWVMFIVQEWRIRVQCFFLKKITDALIF